MARRPGMRQWRPSAVVVVAISIAIGIFGNLATNTVQLADTRSRNLVRIATVLLVVAAIGVEVIRSRRSAVRSAANPLEAAIGDLAAAVREQWSHEAVL